MTPSRHRLAGTVGLLLTALWFAAAPESASAQAQPSNPRLPSLFLIGDSTVRNGQGDGALGQWGWGEPLVGYFDTTRINVVNRALGGLSSRTYLTGGHWAKVLAMLKPGDVVIMQFGHNDNGALNDDSRARGTIKGIGEEVEEIDNILTHAHEVVHTYGWYLRRFVAEARAKGATPIVCSLVPRKIWTDGRIARNSTDYGGWAAAVAAAERAAFIDLNDIIAAEYDRLGPEKVEALFADPHTHTSLAGAELNAANVIAGLEKLATNPLKPYFSGKVTGRFRFDFGTAAPAQGYTPIPSSIMYAEALGYGFDKPSVFSVAVPEGNYRVTVKLGNRRTAGDTTIYAELRRLMLERIRTRPGQFEVRSFIVNVRRPVIAGAGSVVLKDREKTTEAAAWDSRLTIEFGGAQPVVATMDIERVTVPTVYLLGDSTVCDQPLEPFNSWGQMLTRFLKPGVSVANHAESGESLAGALAARRVDKILGEIKPGDYLFVQFGHNDMKSTAPNALQTYTDSMRQLVGDVRRRGATPVLVTSVSRRTFDPTGRTITDSFQGYTQAVRTIAREHHVALIDLQASSAALYEALGPDASHLAFATMQEATHHNDYGSYEIVKCVLQGIRAANLDLSRHIVSDFKGFDPRKPDSIDQFALPKSSLGL